LANAFDAATAPEGEPLSLVVGDFIQWKRSDLTTDYPTDEYTATYVARVTGGGASEIQIAGTVSGGAYLFAANSTSTASYNAGYYHWQLEIVRDSDSNRIVVDRGAFDILVDLDANNADPRIHAEKMLTKIESLLEGRADSDVSNYAIQGRSLTKLSIDELIKWRDYYNAEVSAMKRNEQIHLGRKTSATVKVRFI
tara:strand:+ start:463 stop:1050 length:588 start_codon:yes stop_codon:yes gene_type:complete